ncbi:MAG: hypothetical protein K2I25_07975 [Muribaculaceae bacterium]|nr:hypothetical protein [Muribaculaceae bacterium]
MEKDKISSLFGNYEPELTSDALFMERFERNLRAVELVKGKVGEMRKRNRLAVAVAALTGFVAGIICTLCYPLLLETIGNLAEAGTAAAAHIADYGSFYIWTLICIVTGILTYTAYDITMIATKKSTRTAM